MTKERKSSSASVCIAVLHMFSSVRIRPNLATHPPTGAWLYHKINKPTGLDSVVIHTSIVHFSKLWVSLVLSSPRRRLLPFIAYWKCPTKTAAARSQSQHRFTARLSYLCPEWRSGSVCSVNGILGLLMWVVLLLLVRIYYLSWGLWSDQDWFLMPCIMYLSDEVGIRYRVLAL